MSLAVEMNGQLTLSRLSSGLLSGLRPKTGLGKCSFTPVRQKVAGQTPHGDWKLQKSDS